MQTSVMKRSCVLASLVVVLAACSSDATKSTGPSTVSSDVASTVAGDATTVPAAPTTIGPAPTISVPEGGFGEPTPAVDNPTAWVAGSQEGDPEVPAEVGECQPLYDAIAGGPYTIERCGVWNAQGGARMWTITLGVGGLLHAYVWQQSALNNWVPVMRAVQTAPGEWSDFNIVTGNIDSGENDELVSGLRLAGSGGYLNVSVVDIRSGNPRVMAVLNEIPSGIAVLRPNDGVETWAAVHADADPECCPSSFQRFTLFAAGSDWLGVPGPTVPTGDPAIPPTQF